MENNIKFQLDFDQLNINENLNLIYPKAGVFDYLKAKETSAVLTIRKRDPMLEDNPEDDPTKALIHRLVIDIEWEA